MLDDRTRRALTAVKQTVVRAAAQPGPGENDPWHMHNVLHRHHLNSSEVHDALAATLEYHRLLTMDLYRIPTAVDVTQPIVVPWDRWLASLETDDARYLIGAGIVKVFAAYGTERPLGEPCIVFCRSDDTYARATPGRRVERAQHSGWRAMLAFTEAPASTAGCLKIRHRRLTLSKTRHRISMVDHDHELKITCTNSEGNVSASARMLEHQTINDLAKVLKPRLGYANLEFWYGEKLTSGDESILYLGNSGQLIALGA